MSSRFPASASSTLRGFRARLHGCFARRADAMFELCDAILTTGTIPFPVHLSLAPVHPRGWGSLYAALSKGTIDEEALRDLLVRHAPQGNGAPVYAVDVSPWPRNEADCSPERGYHYHPSRHSAGQPIVAGWAYQLVAGLSFGRDSWVAPVDARRVSSQKDANEVAAGQVRDLVRHLVEQGGVRGEAPLFVFDAGYDPVRFQRGLEDCRPQLLVRLHSGRVFHADPEPRSPRPVGRPVRHGKRFDLKDPETWHEPSSERHSEDAGYGKVRARAWPGLHPKTRRAAERYGCESAVVVKGTVVLVEVERLPRGERRRKPKKLWLWWHGEVVPDLDLLWKAYVRRFDLEHAVKLLKGTLGWTTPRVRHPEQAERWTWLGGCIRATPAGTRHCSGSETTVGAAAARRVSYPRASVEGFRHTLARPAHAGECSETLREIAGTAQRAALRADETLPGREEGRVTRSARNN